MYEYTALVPVTERGRPSKRPSADEQINTAVGSYSGMLLSSEKSDILVCAPAWVDRESMMSEISKLLKDRYYMIPLM